MRVLREGLKASSTEGRALGIHSRAEKDMAACRAAMMSKHRQKEESSYPWHELRQQVPCQFQQQALRRRTSLGP